jgi:hypothetical protein
VEYKKAPDLAARRGLCDQTRGRSRIASLEQTKPERTSNIQANLGGGRPGALSAAQPRSPENIFCNHNGQQTKLNGARLPR